MVERLKASLPSHLRQKLVDTVHAQATDCPGDIVDAAFSSFVEYQQQHSHTYVDMLQEAVHTNGLGVLGTDASLQCLRHGRADVLVLAEEYDPGVAWQCRECGDIQIGRGLHRPARNVRAGGFAISLSRRRWYAWPRDHPVM